MRAESTSRPGVIIGTVAVGRLGIARHDIRLELKVEGIDRILWWEAPQDDPSLLGLEAAAAVALGTPGRRWYCPDVPLKGYPVTVTLASRSGYHHIINVAPAPAGLSPNGLHWVPLELEEPNTPACDEASKTVADGVSTSAAKTDTSKPASPVADLLAKLGLTASPLDTDW